MNVLAWPSQSPDLSPTENLWNTAVYHQSVFNLTELEQEDWANVPLDIHSATDSR